MEISEMGIGTIAWGDVDRGFEESQKPILAQAFREMIEGGVSLFDTAEVYGYKGLPTNSSSEHLLGEYMHELEERNSLASKECVVASKFFPVGTASYDDSCLDQRGSACDDSCLDQRGSASWSRYLPRFHGLLSSMATEFKPLLFPPSARPSFLSDNLCLVSLPHTILLTLCTLQVPWTNMLVGGGVRIGRQAVVDAARASSERLGRPIDLYQVGLAREAGTPYRRG
jgi:aryl-alcohol dehydrogenase-like predicted oxidoreductase